MRASRLALLGAFSVAGCCLQLGIADSGVAASTSGGSSGGATTGGGPCTETSCPLPFCGLGAQICDPEDGKCKCYLGGPSCQRDESCDVYGDCVGPLPCGLCAGRYCPEQDTICDPSGGCDCGHLGGPVCKGGTCRLFFADSGEPVQPDSGDAPIVGRCSGPYDPCYEVQCSPLEACDPDDTEPESGMGRCACGRDPGGNPPGVVCADNEVCFVTEDGGPPECLRHCRPFGEPCFPIELPDASAAIALGCYYFVSGPGGVCARPTGNLGAGQPCQRPTDCAPPLTCGQAAVNGPGSSVTACEPYCDIVLAPDGGGNHPCPPGSVCVSLSPGIPAGICELE